MTPNTLIERLRGLIRVPVNDGAGLLDGKDFFERQFPASKIALEAADRIEALEKALREVTPYVEAFRREEKRADDLARDLDDLRAALAARIEKLEAALREIDNMAPATCEVTLAHQMADIASAALAPEQDK